MSRQQKLAALNNTYAPAPAPAPAPGACAVPAIDVPVFAAPVIEIAAIAADTISTSAAADVLPVVEVPATAVIQHADNQVATKAAIATALTAQAAEAAVAAVNAAAPSANPPVPPARVVNWRPPPPLKAAHSCTNFTQEERIFVNKSRKYPSN